jgi:predicted nucleic acid-binding protein
LPGLNNVVFDSFALIGYLENESFADRVEKILKHAREGKVRIYLHALHLGEVYYITFREKGKELADLAYSRIKAFPLKYIDVIDEALLQTAATLKANYPISYADAFAAAMAILQKSSLLTGDPEFKKLEEKENLSIEWLI